MTTEPMDAEVAQAGGDDSPVDQIEVLKAELEQLRAQSLRDTAGPIH